MPGLGVRGAEVTVGAELLTPGHNSMTSVDTLFEAGLGSTRHTGEVVTDLSGAFRS
jgi:hypothetical protein